MKKFYVRYSITGEAVAVVEAENEEEAIAKARDFTLKEGSSSLCHWDYDSFLDLEGEEEVEDDSR